MQQIVDSHVHLDLIEHYHPTRISWLKENGVHVVSWAYFAGVDLASGLEKCLAEKARCIRTLSESGLGCHFLAGVHPRSISPDLKPERIPSLLEPILADPRCRGIGEIGLETGSTREKEVLIAQLELGKTAMEGGMVVGVHTPRGNKEGLTETTLAILEDFQTLSPVLVVDHCTPETIAPVLDAGYWAGVTLSPDKTSWEEMKGIVAGSSAFLDRIMCNTDSGSMFFEDAVRYSRSPELPEGIREKLFRQNALRFFSLDAS